MTPQGRQGIVPKRLVHRAISQPSQIRRDSNARLDKLNRLLLLAKVLAD